MGAGQSKPLLSDEKKNELMEKVAEIAGDYASSLKFDELTNLFDDEYCSKVEILTKEVLDKNLNSVEIEYLTQHQQKGVDVDFTKVDSTTYIKHGTNLKKNQQTRKNRLCAGLAKYFVKIFKIYAAIVKTLNPVYSSDRFDDKIDLFHFYNINPDTFKINEESQNLNKKFEKFDNICDIRIEILKNIYEKKMVAHLPQVKPVNNEQEEKKQEQEEKKEEQEEKKQEQQNNTQVADDVSSIPEEVKEFKPQQRGGNSSAPAFCIYKGKNLNEEYGINELEDLFKDKFNFTKNAYEMSPQSQEQYKSTLINMYKAFTNKNETPGEEIKTFADIRLEDYASDPLCNESVEDTVITFDNADVEMFKKYGNHLNQMISKTFSKYDLLLIILNEIFSFTKNEKTDKVTVRLNKNISEAKLNELSNKTKDIISQLYLECQNDFTKGISIYKSIVYSKLLKRNQNRQINLQSQISNLNSN